MATVFGLALFGLVAPIWCFRRWRGGWRIAAAIPMVGMVLFVAFLLLTAVFNPDSLGLLPLVVLMAAVPCSVDIVVLFVARKLTGAARREAACTACSQQHQHSQNRRGGRGGVRW